METYLLENTTINLSVLTLFLNLFIQSKCIR